MTLSFWTIKLFSSSRRAEPVWLCCSIVLLSIQACKYTVCKFVTIISQPFSQDTTHSLSSLHANTDCETIAPHSNRLLARSTQRLGAKIEVSKSRIRLQTSQRLVSSSSAHLHLPRVYPQRRHVAHPRPLGVPGGVARPRPVPRLQHRVQARPRPRHHVSHALRPPAHAQNLDTVAEVPAFGETLTITLDCNGNLYSSLSPQPLYCNHWTQKIKYVTLFERVLVQTSIY